MKKSIGFKMAAFALFCCAFVLSCALPMQGAPGSAAKNAKSRATGGTTYYVDAAASTNGTGTSSAPFNSIQSAHDVSLPGDTIYLKGTFNYSGGGALLSITRSGSAAGGPITYTKWPGFTATLKVNLTGSGMSSQAGWDCINIDGASYIVIDGLTLIGANNDVGMSQSLGETICTYYLAQKATQFAATNWTYISSTNTNGLTIQKQYATTNPTNITVKNCDISLFAAGGLGASNADYILFDHNVVHDNSWYTIYATSGIGVALGYNSDSNTGYKSIISDNISYGNKTMVEWADVGKYSDGNGIICDVNMANVANPALTQKVTYNGRTLLINNISYNNGGSGLHAVSAANVDFINNTAYQNSTRSAYQGVYPNIFTTAGSTGDRFYDNIAYAATGKSAIDLSDTSLSG